MKKGELTLTITLGLICFVLVSTMFMQFNTVNKTDIKAIENMRETELRTQISTINTKIEELQKKYDETIQKKEEYIKNTGEDEKTTKLLQEDLKEAKMLLGLTDVTGDGIIVTLEDNELKNIEAADILELINELRLAGAEAISINDERIVANSEVVDINYSFIVANGQRLTSPYVVKAIGNQSYLESGLTAKQYGYIDNMVKGFGKTVSLERKDKISIPKYEGEMTLESAVQAK